VNCASCAGPQQRVPTLEGAPELFIIIVIIYFYKFELCIRCSSTTWSRRTRQGTRLFVMTYKIMIYFDLFQLCIRCCFTTKIRGTSRDTRLLFYFIIIYLFQFIWISCIGCRSTTRSRGTRKGTRLFNYHYHYYYYLFIFISIVYQVSLHKKDLRHRTAHQTFCSICFDLC